MIRTKEWLVAKRKEKGLTQKELAVKTGINVFTIENIEQGKRIGSVETWNALNEYFSDEQEEQISFDSDNLIEEIKQDIKDVGLLYPCYLFYKIENDRIIFTNYDFVIENQPVKLKKGEKVIETTLKYALEVFEEQNKII